MQGLGFRVEGLESKVYPRDVHCSLLTPGLMTRFRFESFSWKSRRSPG